MTGHRCIVSGCKSGYDSCVNKHHFFTVPKDPARLKQWKKAKPRKDFVIKTRQAVCQLHFHYEMMPLMYITCRIRQFTNDANNYFKINILCVILPIIYFWFVPNRRHIKFLGLRKNQCHLFSQTLYIY